MSFKIYQVVITGPRRYLGFSFLFWKISTNTRFDGRERSTFKGLNGWLSDFLVKTMGKKSSVPATAYLVHVQVHLYLIIFLKLERKKKIFSSIDTSLPHPAQSIYYGRACLKRAFSSSGFSLKIGGWGGMFPFFYLRGIFFIYRVRERERINNEKNNSYSLLLICFLDCEACKKRLKIYLGWGYEKCWYSFKGGEDT